MKGLTLFEFFCICAVFLLNTCSASNDQNVAERCLQPVSKGRCRARNLKWYYDKSSGGCKMFYYSGCKGNENRFNSQDECTRTCRSNPANSPANLNDICELPEETGPCRALFPRFFYNSKTKRCESFAYGGCNGNENNFETLQECQDRCNDVCNLPAEPAHCRSRARRYYFDQQAGRCKLTDYGVCLNNKNSFLSLEDCENKCAHPCQVLPRYGPCNGYFLRYYYNTKTQSCTLFMWGGCMANSNNFRSIQTCEQTCKELKCKGPNQPAHCSSNRGSPFNIFGKGVYNQKNPSV